MSSMKNHKILIVVLIAVLLIIAAFAARLVYMNFFKNYKVGEDPKLTEIYNAYCMTSMHSLDHGYIYDKYTIRKKDSKYYAETDIFDEEKEEQVVTQAEITNAEYSNIIKLIDGCAYVRQGKADPDRMDGYVDEENSYADIIWDRMPDGAWELAMDSDTRRLFCEAVKSVVRTIDITFVDDVQPSSVWIIRDIPENRETTVWGTAMIMPDETGKEYTASVPLSEDDKYLFRMIGEDGLYYEADIPKLLDGWKLHLQKTGDIMDASLVIFDDTGAKVQECEVFCAAL